MANIVLGVTGGIAAYKAADLTSKLVKAGHDVRVIMTASALQFIGPLTFQTLTKHQVYTGMFNDPFAEDVKHISLAQGADIAIIVPCTANVIGKLANGIADDMLTTVFMASRAKKLLAPAMNTAMYENPAYRRSVELLKGDGYLFIEPRVSLLACGDVGKGALAEVSDILERINKELGIPAEGTPDGTN